MSSNMLAHQSHAIDIGVNVAVVYRKGFFLSSREGRYPTFEELYECYVEVFIDEHINKQDFMKMEREVLSSLRDYNVEHGFRPELYGMSKEAMFFNALLENQLVFTHDSTTYNQPIVEVW